MPPYIDLLKMVPRAGPEATHEHDDSWVYRFLSGYAHAKVWATTLGMRPVAEQGARGVSGCVEAIDAYTVEMVERVWRIVEAAIDDIDRLWGTAPTGDASL